MSSEQAQSPGCGAGSGMGSRPQEQAPSEAGKPGEASRQQPVSGLPSGHLRSAPWRPAGSGTRARPHRCQRTGGWVFIITFNCLAGGAPGGLASRALGPSAPSGSAHSSLPEQRLRDRVTGAPPGEPGVGVLETAALTGGGGWLLSTLPWSFKFLCAGGTEEHSG